MLTTQYTYGPCTPPPRRLGLGPLPTMNGSGADGVILIHADLA
jgi:hypothetical protein